MGKGRRGGEEKSIVFGFKVEGRRGEERRGEERRRDGDGAERGCGVWIHI